MALINRVSRLFKADFHAVLDQLEEPEQILKQAIRDMEDDMQDELSRFNGGGKTFFFNRKRARNGTEYLSINAMYGDQRYEKLVLFPQHLVEFYKHVKGAIETLTGLTPKEEEQSEPLERCPNCRWHLLDPELNRDD